MITSHAGNQRAIFRKNEKLLISQTQDGGIMLRAARNQAHVIFALIFKEFKQKISRGRLGLIWAFMEPATHMIILSSLWYFIGRETINGVSIMVFVSSGIFPYLIVRRSISTVSRAIKKASALLDYPQVKPFDAVVASFVVEMLLLVLAAILMFSTLFWFLGFSPEIPYPLEALWVLAILFSGGFGIALTFAVLGSFDEGTFSVVKMMMRPLIFVSAVFYGASQVPPAALDILKWNPLLQLIEHFRHFFLGVALFDKANLAFPAYFSFSMLVFSVVFYYRNRYKIIQR